MTTTASRMTSPTAVYSTFYSDANQRKHQRSASLAFVWGIHRDRWIPRTKASYAENVSIWWRHHGIFTVTFVITGSQEQQSTTQAHMSWEANSLLNRPINLWCVNRTLVEHIEAALRHSKKKWHLKRILPSTKICHYIKRSAIIIQDTWKQIFISYSTLWNDFFSISEHLKWKE